MIATFCGNLAREPRSGMPADVERASREATAAIGLPAAAATGAAGASTVGLSALSLSWANASACAASARPGIGCLDMLVVAVAFCRWARAVGVARGSCLSAATFKKGKWDAPLSTFTRCCHGSTPGGPALASALEAAPAAAAAAALSAAAARRSIARAGGGGQPAASGWLAGAAGTAAASCPSRRPWGARLRQSILGASASPLFTAAAPTRATAVPARLAARAVWAGSTQPSPPDSATGLLAATGLLSSTAAAAGSAGASLGVTHGETAVEHSRSPLETSAMALVVSGAAVAATRTGVATAAGVPHPAPVAAGGGPPLRAAVTAVLVSATGLPRGIAAAAAAAASAAAAAEFQAE